MTAQELKQLLDACALAGRIVDRLPELPKGMRPSHIHVLDAVYEICRSQGECRVSDVSARLNVTTPGITRLIGELEAAGMLEKQESSQDRRVALLRLAAGGMECVDTYVTQLHSRGAKKLQDVSGGQVREAAQVIKRLWETIPGKRGE